MRDQTLGCNAMKAGSLRVYEQTLPEILLTTRKTADVLDVGVSTLESWRREGRPPRFIKIGRSVRYRLSDLNKFLEENARKSSSDTGNRS